MRRLVIIALMAIAGYVLWTLWMTRSTTIALEPSGYKLTYTMAWGWGMGEKISFSRFGMFGNSSEWVPIFDKPYNSGVSLYRSAEGDTYFLSAGLRFFKFEALSGNLTSYCHSDMLTYTTLGTHLSTSKSYKAADEAIDPGGPNLFSYIEPDQQSGTIPTSPPNSRYYANLKYLGKFGLVRSSGRGNEVRFVPADISSEPRFGLGVNCG
jgi:hypothetical protein